MSTKTMIMIVTSEIFEKSYVLCEGTAQLVGRRTRTHRSYIGNKGT